MQRVDDVTGDPIRLSAQQRELQRAGMIAMINAQTKQINVLTAEVKALRADVSALRAELDGHIAWHWSENRRRWFDRIVRMGRWV